MMDQSFINTLILGGCYLVLFALGELLYHVFKVKVELTRKFVHIMTGFLAMLFPVLIDNHWLVLVLCASFVVILAFSVKFDLLKSINAIERKSVGNLVYAFAVYGCYMAYDLTGYQYIYYYLPILILAICDPVAALTGKRWPWKPYTILGAHKTVMGSIMFFLSAVILTAIFLLYVQPISFDIRFVMMVVIIAFISTLTEAASRDGYDNITIPFSVIIGLFLTKSLL